VRALLPQLCAGCLLSVLPPGCPGPVVQSSSREQLVGCGRPPRSVLLPGNPEPRPSPFCPVPATLPGVPVPVAEAECCAWPAVLASPPGQYEPQPWLVL